MPVGCIRPNFHEIKMQANKNIDTPTRIASARAILLDFPVALGFPRSMKKSAAAKLARIAKKARLTR